MPSIWAAENEAMDSLFPKNKIFSDLHPFCELKSHFFNTMTSLQTITSYHI